MGSWEPLFIGPDTPPWGPWHQKGNRKLSQQCIFTPRAGFLLCYSPLLFHFFSLYRYAPCIVGPRARNTVKHCSHHIWCKSSQPTTDMRIYGANPASWQLIWAFLMQIQPADNWYAHLWCKSSQLTTDICAFLPTGVLPNFATTIVSLPLHFQHRHTILCIVFWLSTCSLLEYISADTGFKNDKTHWEKP